MEERVLSACLRSLRSWLWAGLAGLAGCASQPGLRPADELADTDAVAPVPSAAHIALAPMPPAADLLPVPDLWARFATGRRWQPCTLTPGVERWIRRYAPKPERFGRSLVPMLPLMDYVLSRASDQGLSAEIMLVPIVESHYRPDARGPGGALGMWQLMPDTARRFGLTIRGSNDERTDVQRSTDAALHLLKLHSDAFQERPKLMFAAYNAGAYRLRKAIAGRDPSSLDSLEGLGLPRTTHDYIDKLKALGCLLGEPARFGVQLPEFPREARLAMLATPRAVDPAELAKRSGIPGEDLRRWNRRAFTRGATAVGESLLLPGSALAHARSLLEPDGLPEVRPRMRSAPVGAGDERTHRVHPGDSLWTISRRYRVRLADLMRWNGLSKRSVLRIGQTIQLQGGSS